jgi:hypothetical protein
MKKYRTIILVPTEYILQVSDIKTAEAKAVALRDTNKPVSFRGEHVAAVIHSITEIYNDNTRLQRPVSRAFENWPPPTGDDGPQAA